MVELSRLASEIMQEHLQNLVSQGYFTVVELATCRVPADPASSALVGGICCGVLDVLRVGIWCTLTMIPSLSAIVLWPRAT
jgi:hypothetical protein